MTDEEIRACDIMAIKPSGEFLTLQDVANHTGRTFLLIEEVPNKKAYSVLESEATEEEKKRAVQVVKPETC